jgi:hypothetical protein
METSVHIGFEQLKQMLLQLSPDEIEDVKIFLDDLQRAKKRPREQKEIGGITSKWTDPQRR